MPINAATMTPEEKLQFLEDQILQVRAGELQFMLCPYCGTENSDRDQPCCCKLFVDAVDAILTRMDKQDAVDFMENVADRTHQQAVNATKKWIN